MQGTDKALDEIKKTQAEPGWCWINAVVIFTGANIAFGLESDLLTEHGIIVVGQPVKNFPFSLSNSFPGTPL